MKPTVYIACGISGATQHMVGMKGAKNIIAINKDQDAPIFAIADLGVVGDVTKVLPKLIESIKARQEGPPFAIPPPPPRPAGDRRSELSRLVGVATSALGRRPPSRHRGASQGLSHPAQRRRRRAEDGSRESARLSLQIFSRMSRVPSSARAGRAV